jgi:hypothetical protein
LPLVTELINWKPNVGKISKYKVKKVVCNSVAVVKKAEAAGRITYNVIVV